MDPVPLQGKIESIQEHQVLTDQNSFIIKTEINTVKIQTNKQTNNNKQ